MSDFSSITAKRRISLDYQTLIHSSAAIASLLDLRCRPDRAPCAATTAQSQVLFNFGVQHRPQTYDQAEVLIARIRLRQRQELASVKQLAYLVALGVDPGEARRLSKDDASSASSRASPRPRTRTIGPAAGARMTPRGRGGRLRRLLIGRLRRRHVAGYSPFITIFGDPRQGLVRRTEAPSVCRPDGLLEHFGAAVLLPEYFLCRCILGLGVSQPPPFRIYSGTHRVGKPSSIVSTSVGIFGWARTSRRTHSPRLSHRP